MSNSTFPEGHVGHVRLAECSTQNLFNVFVFIAKLGLQSYLQNHFVSTKNTQQQCCVGLAAQICVGSSTTSFPAF